MAERAGSGRRGNGVVESLDDLQDGGVGAAGRAHESPLEHDEAAIGKAATEEGVLARPVLAERAKHIEAPGPESAHRVQRPGQLGIGLE
jgi:hypothetical protein